MNREPLIETYELNIDNEHGRSYLRLDCGTCFRLTGNLQSDLAEAYNAGAKAGMAYAQKQIRELLEIKEDD